MARRAFLTGGAAAGMALPVLLRPSLVRAAPAGIPVDGKVSFKVMRKAPTSASTACVSTWTATI
ncbi:MAG: hypothetical protein WDN45_07760 [Caulobacteraceae bacterium]